MNRKKKSIRLARRLSIIGLLGTGIAYGGLRLNQAPEPAPEYRLESVKRGSLAREITAGGQIVPEVRVEVGSMVAGIVVDVHADFGSAVKEGQPLAQLERTTYVAALKAANINLANARIAARLAATRAEQAKTLQGEGLLARTDYDKAIADLEQLKGAVKIAQSAVERATIDLDRCTIRSPIDGVVITRGVSAGQSVGPSSSAPPLFVIAQDLKKMQIEASVSEADIGGIKAGQEAVFTVDAYPDRKFRGKVAQIRNAATTADQTVVSYTTIIQADNDKLELKPGMTANVSIITDKREGVLRIPNTALRFRPAGEEGTDEPSSKSDSDKEKASRKDSGGKGAEATVYRPAATGPGNERDPMALEAVPILVGFSDGRNTEVVKGLDEGNKVVVGVKKTEEKDEGFLAWIPAMLTGRKDKKR